MRRLFGKAHPYFVLLGLLRGEQGKDGHNDEDEHDAKLHIGPCRESLDHDRVVVAHVNITASERVFTQIDANVAPVGQEPSAHLRGLSERVGFGLGLNAQVAEGLHLSVVADNNDGDGVVLVNDAQDQPQIGILVGAVERTHGLGPHFHLVAFLYREVAHEEMRDDERDDSYEHCRHDEHNLHLTYFVGPLHDYITS